MASTVMDEFRQLYGDIEPEWQNLAWHVTKARNRLGLTQEELAAKGGPSTASLRLIEGAGQENYRMKTFRRLDYLLHWPPGGYLTALAGLSPYMAQTAMEFWDRMYPETPEEELRRLREIHGPHPDERGRDPDAEEIVRATRQDSYVAEGGPRLATGDRDDQILEAIREMREDIAAIKERLDDRS